MIVLGIESSCDETAAALVEDGRKILSSVVASQVEEHKIYGGVVPEIASRRHSEAIVAVVQEALERGRKKLSQVDAIAVTYAPGLIGALLVGVNFAKGQMCIRDRPRRPGRPAPKGPGVHRAVPGAVLFGAHPLPAHQLHPGAPGRGPGGGRQRPGAPGRGRLYEGAGAVPAGVKALPAFGGSYAH